MSAENVKNIGTAGEDSIRRGKLPPFCKEDPTQWFMHAEKVFTLKNITSDITKFQHVIVNLDSSTLSLFRSIVMAPPEQGKYETLKKRIIKVFGELKEFKPGQFFVGQEKGDDKPIIFVEKLRLAAGHCDDEAIKTVFSESLSKQAKTILVDSRDNLDELARRAEAICNVIKPTNTTSCSTMTIEEAEKENLQIDAKIDALQQKFEAFELRSLRKRSDRNHMPERILSRSPWRPSNSVCRRYSHHYHNRFETAAFRCVKPCCGHM